MKVNGGLYWYPIRLAPERTQTESTIVADGGRFYESITLDPPKKS